ncbi:MAG: signal peptidase I [Pseudodesulfovibrio sp.]|uniref:Signal peptidase I n=1 Tax=Pseudodesulfovibrio aespoeensis (strain ATCC 700646 / DSM 10631 / Aspo-2) TaxID=643562 RepID=E6VUE0_PSEA9|nr:MULTISPECIES: signal peptidase I [Pseudodesulfovibrio]MBU4190962.1 signal peptidase I [Pseudomonadota bacterium]ADU63447.1 signal peptidase I [Pseudodesulfovibrio aespoeensis Aspo-2]MBU4243494.1 signal peptidase I [Pseudomonadota bacterium]MBU4377641.1 signal peptidase I [Pseudomonadota bacterium]MBU4473828.1 signal peptidase I [Pseudomonadota bacterium]
MTHQTPRTDDAAFAAMASGVSGKRRRPWLAALLSLMATGVGQLYNGQWRKGACFLAGEVVLALALIPALRTFAGLVLAGGVLATYNIAAAVDAYRCARRGGYVPTRFNRWWAYALAVGISAAAGAGVEGALKAQFYQNFKVPSVSMQPALRVGDRFLAARLRPDSPIGRGQVVVFIEPGGGRHFVKRVVGLPGETVRVEGREVVVNGQRLDEPYARHTGGSTPHLADGGPLRLGPDQYFLMGDNRDKSYDSRWLGPVPRERIMARALYVYYPGPSGAGWASRFGETVR